MILSGVKMQARFKMKCIILIRIMKSKEQKIGMRKTFLAFYYSYFNFVGIFFANVLKIVLTRSIFSSKCTKYRLAACRDTTEIVIGHYFV